jgi:O-Antigen ligase
LSTAVSPTHVPAAATPGRVIATSAIRNLSVWLLFASGFLVIVEPAPFEIAFAVMAAVFMLTGLRISIMFLPLIALLILYNIGGGMSLMQVADESRAIWFIAISAYMAVMGIFVAAVFSEDTGRRLELMKAGYVFAGVLASITGIMGYFNIAGTFELFTKYGRAMGTFKDPNVFSTYLILPFVILVQGFFLGTHKRPALAFLSMLIITVGLFLSFSRGAWGVAVGATALCVGLGFITIRSNALRVRIVLIGLAGIGLFALMLVIALQFEAIRETFEVRASLNQEYDVGETGRFGNHLRAIPYMLNMPHGFGPTMFRDYFPEDPHNTYLNAFSSYGWLGGVAYLALVVVTMMVGWSLVFKRSPFQQDAIAVWSCFFFLMLQGLQIDTDHWRHFYLQLGLTWGLMLASLRYQSGLRHQAALQANPAPTAAR